MRIFVCLVAVALALGIPASAQAQSGFAGIKGGVVVGKTSASGAGSFDTHVGRGGAIGVFAGIKLGETVRIQPEVLLTGRRFSDSTDAFSISARAIEVPILLHFRFATDRRAHPVLFVGPQITFVSNVRQTTAQAETDIDDRIGDTDTGLTFGAGFEMSAGRGSFVVDGRVNVGLKDLSETGPPALKSRAFLLMAGYRF